MDKLDNFLETLRELMYDNSLTQRQLAEKIGVEPSAVAYWFGKIFFPRISNLIKLADIFHCSIDYLFGMTDKKDFVPSSTAASFLTRFDELKERMGVNDYRVSKLCKLSNSTVSKWRRYNRYPDTLTVFKLTEFFDCSIEFLIGRANGCEI